MRNVWLWACLFSGINVDVANAAEPESAKEDRKLTITGSLIKKTDQSGPSPILTLTSEDFARLGHSNLYEALTALTAQTGSLLEGDQFPNGFTSAAQAINLRGFGPGRTLVLVNGQRLALNPTPYQSESNFFNFAIIPTVAIERVDVLTDGASAIYGSDAVAGVINVILREEFDSNELSFSLGKTTRGGGSSTRVAGGNSFRSSGALATFGYQWEKHDPIYSNDRSYLAQVDAGWAPVTIGVEDPANNLYALSDPSLCSPHGLTAVSTNVGDYCTRGISREDNLRNQRETFSLFNHSEVSVSFGRWFMDAILWQSDINARNFPLHWSGYVDDSLGQQVWVSREFNNQETGNQDKQFDEESHSLITGFDGIARSFDYQFTLSYSSYESIRRLPLLRADTMPGFFSQADQVFNLFQPSDFTGFLGNSLNDATSYSTTASYWMSGEGFTFNAHPSEYALVVEWNRNKYNFTVDEITRNFGWYGFGGSTGGAGSRERVAVGGEWFIPVLKGSAIGDLDITVATRWDDYHDKSSVKDAKTWKGSFQWRPTNYLSVNGVHSTSFRAPDMHYLFAEWTGYYTDVIDIHSCVNVAGNSYAFCRNNTDYLEELAVGWEGTQQLQEEEGTTTTFGIALALDELNVSLDFYDIELENQVGLQLESHYLLWEAQCRAGTNFTTGETVDNSSSICQDAISRILRFNNDPDSIVWGLYNTPVNRALRRQKGFELAVNWLKTTDSFGAFGIDLRHSEILKTEVQSIASEPSTFNPDFKHDPSNGELNQRSNLSFSWTNENWSSALSFFRKGSQLNAAASSKIKPWVITNLMAQYQVSQKHMLSFTVRNLTDKKPPIDTTMMRWPYFDRSQYDAVGRELFLEYRIQY